MREYLQFNKQMSRYTKSMPESRRFVRLPTLPSWEKLLSRLYVLPDVAVDRNALRLELLGLISNESVSLAQLYSRLCVFLPRISGCEGAIIGSLGEDGFEIFASNLSPKKTQFFIESKTIQKLAKPEHYYFNKRAPGSMEIDQKLVTNFHILSVGSSHGRQLYLLCVSTRAISGDSSRVLEVIKQVLGLRLNLQSSNQNLRQQETKMATLTQQLGEGMAVLGSDLRITLWNRALQRLTGFKTKDALGQPINELLLRADQVDWFELIAEQAKNRGPGHSSADFEITTKDGDRRWISCLASIYKNDAGVLEQIVLVARDISHSKTLEQKKNEFISIATHELRTPLTAIKGYLSLLERKNSNLTEKQISYLAQATKASNRLVGLAEDLLKVVQIEQDRIQFKPQVVHVLPLIKKIVRDFKPKAQSKGVTLSLSKPIGSDALRLDPERTEQIFSNLIDNAIKYTQQGTVKISFEEVGERNDQKRHLVVNIRDTGIGIGLKSIEEVFEKFHRAHRPEQSKEQGAGLGLYIVKSFVEKQRGTITVKSRVGKGTHFAVSFPLDQGRSKG